MCIIFDWEEHIWRLSNEIKEIFIPRSLLYKFLYSYIKFCRIGEATKEFRKFFIKSLIVLKLIQVVQTAK